ncbi:MAG TPA: FtsX-like permease family protein, partial [Thermoplasmata archaeon]|nr:FtsX-like permease family protein [Thermoplasmata archaeon]
QFAGGFEILGTSMMTIPESEIDSGIEAINQEFGDSVIERIETGTTSPISVMTVDLEEPASYVLIGFNETFLETGAFSLQARGDGYASDIDAWTAIFEHDDLVIIDGSVVQNIYGPSFGLFTADVGDEITLIMRDGTPVNVTIAGITDQYFLQGVYSSALFIDSHSPTSSDNLFYVATLPSETVTNQDIANALESRYVNYGMSTFVIKDTVEEFLSIVSSTMQLMEIFLGIGLIVGISGLGIITIRNVAERRQEIGVMRAIGYQRRMILNTFLIETSYVALLGILIGVTLGLALSVNLFEFGGFSETSRFVVPWSEIALIVLVSLGFTIASTYPPSRRASRLAPAEALRRVD